MDEWRQEVANFYIDPIGRTYKGPKYIPRHASTVINFDDAMTKKMDEYQESTKKLIYGFSNMPY